MDQGLSIVVSRAEVAGVIGEQARRLDARAARLRRRAAVVAEAEASLAKLGQDGQHGHQTRALVGGLGCGDREEKQSAKLVRQARTIEARAAGYRFQAEHLAPGESFTLSGHEMHDFLRHKVGLGDDNMLGGLAGRPWDGGEIDDDEGETEIAADPIARAQAAYAAYGATTEYKNYQGLPMPEWHALTDTIREAWVNAATAAAAYVPGPAAG